MKFLNIDRNIVHIYFFLKNEILGNIDYYRIDQNKVYKICMKLLSDWVYNWHTRRQIMTWGFSIKFSI